MDSKPSCRHLFNERRVRFGLIEKQRIRGVGIERGQGVKDSRFKDSRFNIQGVKDSRFKIQDSRFDIQDSRFEVVVKAISFKIRVLVYKFQIHE